MLFDSGSGVFGGWDGGFDSGNKSAMQWGHASGSISAGYSTGGSGSFLDGGESGYSIQLIFCRVHVFDIQLRVLLLCRERVPRTG
jgi:hypothetical protein